MKEKGRKEKGKKVQYYCSECGLVVTIDKPCTCTSCDLICCGKPLKRKKATKTKKG